jgi:hypothetical protein
MPNTFVKIASVTVGSGGAVEIAFTSIPSTYTDLCLKLSARSTLTGTTVATGVLFINTNTSNGSWRNLAGDGSSGFSTNNSGYIDGTYFPATNATASTFGNSELYFTNYASTTTAKAITVDGVTENNATLAYTTIRAILWNNTAAITQIGINGGGANFAQHSTATLYGIKNS